MDSIVTYLLGGIFTHDSHLSLRHDRGFEAVSREIDQQR